MTRIDQKRRATLCRGTVVTVASPGVTLCPLTSTLMAAPLVRIPVDPSPRHGLRKPSQLMVDKLFSVSMNAVGAVVGQLEPQALIVELDLALRGWLALP